MKRRSFLTGLFAMACAPLVPKMRNTVKAYGVDDSNLTIYGRYVRRSKWEGTNIPRIQPGKIIDIANNDVIIEQLARQGQQIDLKEFTRMINDMFGAEKRAQRATGKIEWPKSS